MGITITYDVVIKIHTLIPINYLIPLLIFFSENRQPFLLVSVKVIFPQLYKLSLYYHYIFNIQ